MKTGAVAALLVLSCFAACPRASQGQASGSCGSTSIALIGDRGLTVNPDNSSASREVVLRNTCSDDVKGLVVVTDFVSETTGSPLGSQTTVSKQKTDDSWERVRGVTVPGKQDLLLKLDVTNLWEAGRSKATMSFDDRALGELLASNYRLPFAITLATTTPVTISQSKPMSLVLTNGGAHSYPIHWSFGPAGEKREEGKVTLSPNGDGEIQLTPPDSWFESSFERFFRPAERTVLLTLSMTDPGEVRPDLPRKTISVPVKLESYSAWSRFVVSNLTVLLLLSLGAICSLLVNNWVPNRLRRVSLQQRIQTVAIATRGVSERISSLLRVHLRVQRHQDSERLEKVWTWSPNFETVAADCTRSIDDLSARVELTAQIDRLISRLFDKQDVPVSVVDRSLEEFKPTIEELAKAGLPAATLDEIRKQIAAVAMRLTSAPEAQLAIAQDLFERWQKLKNRLGGTVKNSTLFKATDAPLKELMATVNTQQFTTAGDIDPGEYCSLDIALIRLKALLDAYDEHDRRSPAQQQHMTGLHAKNDTRSFMEILHADYVANGTPESVRSAKLLVEQMKDGVYADDIVKALKNPNPPTAVPQIVVDPPLPYTDEAITFSLKFPQSTGTNSAALRKLRCEWDFGDQLKERGWIVNHYFPQAKEYTITVTILDLDGVPVDVGQQGGRIERKLRVPKSKKAEWVSGRIKTEIVYMLVALGAAIAALLSGAKQSLLQVDFVVGLVAVFLVGFGANSIKNVLTKGRTP